MTRTLTLRREALAALSDGDLAAVAGGDLPYSNPMQLTCQDTCLSGWTLPPQCVWADR